MKKYYLKHIVIYLIKYTIVFSLIWILSHLVLYLNGNTMLDWDDCISAYYEMEPFKSQALKGILTGGSTWTNFNLAGDMTQIAVNGFDLFDIIWIFFPGRNVETIYVLLSVFRVWMAGLCVTILLLYKGVPTNYLIPGSMIYVLWGFILVNGVVQPVYTPMFVFLPILMLGMERIINERKGCFFSIVLGLCFFFSAAQTYFLLLGLAFYYILLLVEYRIKGREILTRTLFLIVYGVLGICLGMPLGMPNIHELLSTTRLGNEVLEYSTLKDFIRIMKEQIGHIFLVSRIWDNTVIGVSIVCVFEVAYALIAKGRNKIYSVYFILGLLIMIIPWFREIFGPTVASTQWNFILGILAAIQFGKSLPEMFEECNVGQLVKTNIVTIVFLMFTIYLIQKEGFKILLPTIIVYITSVILFNLMLFAHKPMFRNFCIYFILFISATLSGYYAFTILYHMDMRGVKRGTVASRLETYAPKIASTISKEDDTLYRVDQTVFDDEMLCNLSYWYGYNGTGAFTGLLHSEFSDYCIQMENTGMVQINKFTALGGKLSDETLGGVKYYILDTKSAMNVPYGFELIKEDGEFQLYKNQNNIAFLAFYRDSISCKTFESLNIAEKEEAMMQAMVMENGSDSKAESYNSTEIPFEIIKLDGVVKTKADDTKEYYLVNEKNAGINLKIQDWNGMGELYVELRGASCEGTGNYKIVVKNGDLQGTEENMTCEKQVFTGKDQGMIGGKYYLRKNGQKNLCFCLGAYDDLNDDNREICISIPAAKGMHIEDIKVYRRDLLCVDEDIKLLNSIDVKNQEYRWDYFSADIEAVEDGYLFFSIPYRKNWECQIDGHTVDTFKANYMYIGAKVDAGKHTVILRYVPREFYIGLFFCIFSVVCLILITISGSKGKG